MSVPDLLNALFECGGAFVMALNIRAVRRDRAVAGVSWPAMAFFAAWGLWNVCYYPLIGQWLSAGAGAVLCVLNIVWVAHLVAYSRNPKEGMA